MLCFYIRGSLRENLDYVSISRVPSGRSYVMFLYRGFPRGSKQNEYFLVSVDNCKSNAQYYVSRLTQRVPLVEQEVSEFTPGFSGVSVTRSLVLCACFVDRCLSVCTFSFTIMLSVLLRLTDSDYPFSMFKLFLHSVDLGSGSNINRRIASLAKVAVFGFRLVFIILHFLTNNILMKY